MKWIALALSWLTFNVCAQQIADVAGHNKLALKLLAATHKNSENIMLSPFNIYSNLAMIGNGAAGTTEREIFEVLNSRNPSQVVSLIQKELKSASDHKVVSIANSFWLNGNIKLKQDYSNRFKEEFNGEEYVVPSMSSIEAVTGINRWVSDKTAGKIENAVDITDLQNCVAALVNTILFKGTWTMPFDKRNTKQNVFYRSSGELTSAMFMHRTGPIYSYNNEWLECYELFFHDSLSFVIATGTGSLPVHQLIEEFEFNPSLITNLKTTVNHLEFYLPKFKFNYKTQLAKPLESIGLKSLFDQADLNRMFDVGGIKVDKILHSTDIEVNEEGVEAAAATVGVFSRSMPPKVKLDHPFLFFILSKPTNAIIFEGVLEDPGKK